MPSERIRYDVVGDAHPAAAEVIDLRYPNGFAVRAPGALEPHDGNGHPHRDNLH